MAMAQRIEPVLHPVKLAHLRPTQMTVGMAEVARKRHGWRERAIEREGEWLGRHMIPAVIGPKGEFWMIDHHHLARALLDEGVEHVLISVQAQLDHLSREQFLTFMDNRNWLHPYDEHGQRCSHKELPRRLDKLRDDRWRSLAGEVRRMGGFAKSATPYAEFLWADFLRSRVSPKLLDKRPERARAKALDAARSKDAAYLPGWAGFDD
ncbi:MAG: chromosome partitioning protein ParB [Sphingomonadales bacterium]|nr:chromosome partitioning protein ParB [Sphingomonadales bacterium]